MDPVKILKSDFLDILFDQKNKAYGAYYLRRTYTRRLEEAMIIMLASFIAILSAYFIVIHYSAKTQLVNVPKIVEVTLTDINTKNENQPPPPPPPPAPKELKLAPAIEYTTPKVVKDQNVKPEEQLPDIEQIKTKAISTQNLKGVEGGIDPNLVRSNGTGVTNGNNKGTEETRVFQFVEQMPRFPGSISDEDSREKVLEFLQKNVAYPDMAKENGIQGIVVVSFVVSKDGAITDIKTEGPVRGGGLEEEAIRVVKLMPKWLPGKQNGIPVNVMYSLPVRFELR